MTRKWFGWMNQSRYARHRQATLVSDLRGISPLQSWQWSAIDCSSSHLVSWLVMGGILFVLPTSAVAQLAPIADDTLGNERSIVSPDQVIRNLPSNQIDGGARRGSNLFHSFRDFNVDGGRGVYFTNPAGVANILTRVTGGNSSQILGTLGVLGNANLFLINPNGILFGPNARLDFRGGSFLASTANSILFNNSFAFSATDPQAPPLLTVNVPIGLQYGSNPGKIRSQGARLQVPTGQTLTLAGGAVTVDGGQLFAFGGRVEVAGVADAGEVGLTQQRQEWRLSVPDGLARADVAIGNGANVNVRAGGGGNIAIIAQNLAITGAGTGLRAGIAVNLGTVSAQAGDIDINATKAVNLNAMLISNATEPRGTGNAGDIRITTGTLSLTNGALLSDSTFGQGDAGNITITARDAASFKGASSNRFTSLINAVETGAIGQGGNISITTGNLSFSNGAQMSTSVRGQGKAGDIIVIARDTVSLDGTDSNGQGSGAFSEVAARATGQGGNISITTGLLSLTNGAAVSATTLGRGNAGNITITARDAVSFDGASNNQFSGGAFSQVRFGAEGQGGSISITTGALSITDGGNVNANTNGIGDAGNITIVARDAVSIRGVGSNGIPSGVVSNVTRDGVGQGGNISITTGVLSITNGGNVNVNTNSIGDAGNITIVARDAISIDGVNNSRISSGVFSQVTSTATGRGGDIGITTNSLSLTNGAEVAVSTFGRGNAGNITIIARDGVFFDGVGSNKFASGAFSLVNSRAIGQAGKITIQTELFSIANKAILSASSSGQGSAGNLDVTVRQLRLDNQGSIQAQTASGQGGNITLQVPDLLLLRRGSFISTTAGTAQAGGDGGNITFKGNFIVAVPNENSDISANAFTGKGGRVEITTQGIFGTQFRPQLTFLSDITASSTFGIAGVVAINEPSIDPNRGLVRLPVDLTDASRLIVQACPTGSTIAQQSNEFIITGRGGLPPTPNEAVNQDAIQVELGTADVEGIPPVSQRQQSASTIAPPIVEAQRLQVMADGTVFLMAALPDPVAPLPDRLVPCP
ncbi:filamentous hemagglutinin N-terminal domain-containing protein [Phormidesmis sp. 146-12]